jgi:RNA polymerase sigma factor (sigma-70 family)
LLKERAVCEAPEGIRDAAGDGDLLARFAAGRDEAAFRALVERHGGMVYEVCRRVLRDPHEAEDAFQATFLVLAQKAKSLRAPALLANWLYGVAHRVAAKARGKMRASTADPVQPADPAREPALQAAWREVETALDEELSRLPDKYRAPLVLCYLQSKTHEEAAALLDCPPGSMSWLLAKGRELLRRRLKKRGVALSLGLLLLGLSSRSAAASAPLVERTVQLALGDAIAPAAEAAAASGRVKQALALLGALLAVFLAGASIYSALPTPEPEPSADRPAALIAPVAPAGGQTSSVAGSCATP